MESAPDWQEIARIDAETHSRFAAEGWDSLMRQCYSIVLNKEIDNQEIVSIFLGICENSKSTKRSWMDWLIMTYPDRDNGPFTHIEVMQYLTHLSMVEERNIMKIVGDRQVE